MRNTSSRYGRHGSVTVVVVVVVVVLVIVVVVVVVAEVVLAIVVVVREVASTIRRSSASGIKMSTRRVDQVKLEVCSRCFLDVEAPASLALLSCRFET